MPAKPGWFSQIPEILKTLAAMQTPVVDRATCERLFHVRRRRAIYLLQGFGGYVAGHTVLINRADLIEQLQAMQTHPDVQREIARKEKLSDELSRIRRHSIATAVTISPPRLPNHAGWAAPEGVRISPGRLTIDFDAAEELLSRLYGLAQAIAGDYGGFTAVLDSK